MGALRFSGRKSKLSEEKQNPAGRKTKSAEQNQRKNGRKSKASIFRIINIFQTLKS
jgi:hypothetical protein